MDKTPGKNACGIGGALTIGLGSIIGGSLFATMGTALQGAGGAAPLAYLLGAIPAWITAYSYIRLAAAHPGAGGTMAYFDLAFGGGYISAGLNLMLVVCYAAVASLYAGVFGSYVADLFGWHSAEVQRLMSCVGIIAVAYMNLSTSGVTHKVQTPLNACKFLVMGVFIISALLSPIWAWDNFDYSRWESPGSITTTALTIFMSYQGFELLAAIRRPMRSARYTLPIAMLLCLLIVTLYYCTVSFCTVGNVNYDTAGAESSYLLSAVAQRFMGEAGKVLLCAGAIVASTSALNADIFSVSSIPEQMAETREMPRYFLPTQREARTLGVIFLCGLLVIFVNLLSVAELTAISSLGFLIIYTLANASAVKITKKHKRAHFISIIGALICLGSAITIAWQLYHSKHSALLLGVTAGMLLLPFIWQALYYNLRSRRR